MNSKSQTGRWTLDIYPLVERLDYVLDVVKKHRLSLVVNGEIQINNNEAHYVSKLLNFMRGKKLSLSEKKINNG